MHRDEAIAHAERLLRRSLMLDALRYGEFTLASGATLWLLLRRPFTDYRRRER